MIYLDHHAATPLLPQVLDAISAAHTRAWANPQSVHAAGRAARSLLEQARADVARSIGANPSDLVFTSGGTEACNIGLFGLLPLERAACATIVASPTEHPALAAGLERLAQAGARINYLDAWGGRLPTPCKFGETLDLGATLAVVQWVNHETGHIAPIAGYAREAALRSVPLLVDGCQAYGRLPIDVTTAGLSALVVAASKVGGPKGAGALWIARGRELTPLAFGSSQEKGRRPGTPDVAALQGFAMAARNIPERLAHMPQVAALRDKLEHGLLGLGAVINGAEGPRVASVTNVSMRGWRSDHLVAALDIEGVCASAGAACSSGLGAPSPVLVAMYPNEPWRAESALRLSLGPETQELDVTRALDILQRVLTRVESCR